MHADLGVGGLPVIAVLDRDAERCAAITAALGADGWTVIVPASPEELPSRCVVLFAPDRSRPGAFRGLVAQLRGTTQRAVYALSSTTGTPPDGPEVLATAQSAGCDGCMVYASPTEITSVLRACVVTPCG